VATGQYPTLIDVASRTDPTGKQRLIAEMLSQWNAVLDDLMIKKASEITSHTFTYRTSIPGGYWAGYNQGVPVGKSTTAQGTTSMGRLQSFSQIDKNLVEDNSENEEFRLSEDQAFIEGMSQTMAETIFYGNTFEIPSQFMGFSTIYNTTNTSTKANARNVISAGGTGSSNASIWCVGWGDRSTFAVHPRNSDSAGLKVENLGDVFPAYDQLGNMFRAYTTHFQHAMGLVVEDWRTNFRICNIDTTNAGLAGPNPPNLFDFISNSLLLLPTAPKMVSGITQTDAPGNPTPANNYILYVNRTIRAAMDKQAIRDRNVLLNMRDYAGIVVDTYRGVPIKIVDQLVNTESTVN
jgi:hypothetical protein